MRGLTRPIPAYLEARKERFANLEQVHQHIHEFVPIELLSQLTVMTLTRKHAVYQPGDDSKDVYYLLDGCVTLYTSTVTSKKKRKQSEATTNSGRNITLSDTYFGEHEVSQEKRRVHTVLVESPTTDILVVPSKHYSQMKLLRKQQSSVFEGLHLSLTYQLIPKMMRVEEFVKGQEFYQREYPIGVILSGHFEVRRQLDLIKEDVDERLYEFRKVFPLLSFGPKQTLLWNCICTSAFAEVMVMDLASYARLCEFDNKLNSNREETINTFELAVNERKAEIRKTFDYKDVEQSLGLSVHFKTQPFEENMKKQSSLRSKLSERGRMFRLRKEILERAQQPKMPDVMANVLFKLPINRQRVSEVKRKLEQLEVKNSECPQYQMLNKEFNRLFTPNFNSKFQLKMLQNTRSVGKTAGFAFFSDKEKSCRKRRSLVLIS